MQRLRSILHPFLRIGLSFVLLAAAFGKLGEVERFAASLDTWTIVPSGWSASLALGVGLFELIVALALLLGAMAATSAFASFVFLWVVTFAYMIESLVAKRPECYCFGRLAIWSESHDALGWILVRNAILVTLSWFVFRHEAKRDASLARPIAPSVDSSPHSGSSRRTAFSLIELLVVIAITAVLLSLLFPALAKVRAVRDNLRIAADMRSHAQIMHTYANDYDDMWPFVTDPTSSHTVLRAGGRTFVGAYFDARFLWQVALAPGFYNDNPFHPSLYTPAANPDLAGTYWYSSAMVAKPDFWDLSTRTLQGQLAPTRVPDTRFPSKKVLLLNFEGRLTVDFATLASPLPSTKLDYAGADGAASTIAYGDMKPPCPGGDGPPGWPYASMMSSKAGLHTFHGVLGTDIP